MTIEIIYVDDDTFIVILFYQTECVRKYRVNLKKKFLIAEKSNEQNYSIQNYISVIWLSIHLFQQIEINNSS